MKLVYGVGHFDANYVTHISEKVNGKFVTKWKCPYYHKWMEMLRRCYSESFKSKRPNYVGCSVHPDWHSFSKFKTDIEYLAQLCGTTIEDSVLDKDLIIKGNTVYSKDTCLLVDLCLNVCLNAGGHKYKNSDLPIGVSKMKGNRVRPYVTQLEIENKLVSFYFHDILSAHQQWQRHKIERLIHLSGPYSEYVKSKIMLIVDSIKQDLLNNKFTEVY